MGTPLQLPPLLKAIRLRIENTPPTPPATANAAPKSTLFWAKYASKVETNDRKGVSTPAGRIPLDDRGIAGIVICAGIKNAQPGIGETADEVLGMIRWGIEVKVLCYLLRWT